MMKKFFLVKVFLCIFVLINAGGAWAQADKSTDITTNAAGVDEVLVVGVQPGPSLWKIYKDDHVLWILGTHKPLPKLMQWHSAQVEAAIAQSQVYIAPPAVKVKLSTLQIVSILPSAMGVKNNPNGEKLSDVLSPDTYLRWQLLKKKYIGKANDIEKYRPFFAAKELLDKALEKENLTSDTNILFAVNQLAQQHQLRIVTPTEIKTLESPRKFLKQFKRNSLNDTECFERTLVRLESELNDVRIHANAWAMGDLTALKNVAYPDQTAICYSAVFNSSIMEGEHIRDIPQQALQVWLAEAEKSIAENASTFAALPINQLQHPEGFLAAFRARGYEVVEP
jgi:uncharacterized protein YbaP (TraB family)